MKATVAIFLLFTLNMVVFAQDEQVEKTKIEVALKNASDTKLILTIISMDGIPSQDAFSSSDLLYEVYCSDEFVYKCERIRNEDNPVFNHELHISNYDNEKVEIRIWDKDLTRHQHVGVATVSTDSMVGYKDYDVKIDGPESGTVKIHVEFENK